MYPEVTTTSLPHAGVRAVGRWLLAGALAYAGFGHFVSSEEFLAQVPPWLPFPEAIVAISGVVEISLAAALLFLSKQRVVVGWVTAAFFVLIFPGNVSQLVTGTDAFGLDSDLARAIRLLFQPLLVVWALWCTGAWHAWRRSRSGQTSE